MSSFSFLHAADLHLDAPLVTRTEQARNQLREAQQAALAQLIELAMEHRVNALLLAGDCFDHEVLSYSTRHRFRAALDRLSDAGIQVFVCSGNHDPATPKSFYKRETWPEKVTLFLGKKPELAPLVVDGQEAALVHGAGFPVSVVTDNLAARFKRDARDLFQIGLLHANISEAGSGHDPYAPASLADLRKAGLDYWALGHIHAGKILSDEPFVVYPGIIQGRDFGETGPKGCYLVKVEDGRVADTVFLPLHQIQWIDLEVALDPSLEAMALPGAIHQTLMERFPDVSHPDFVRVRLAGSHSIATECQDPVRRTDLIDSITESLGVALVELDSSSLRMPIDRDRILEQDSVLAEFLRRLQSLGAESGEQQQLLDKLQFHHRQWPQLSREEKIAYLEKRLTEAEEAGLMRLHQANG